MQANTSGPLFPGFPNIDTKPFGLGDVCCRHNCNVGLWSAGAAGPSLQESGDSPGGAVVKDPPANAGDTGLSPGPATSHVPRSS